MMKEKVYSVIAGLFIGAVLGFIIGFVFHYVLQIIYFSDVESKQLDYIDEIGPKIYLICTILGGLITAIWIASKKPPRT